MAGLYESMETSTTLETKGVWLDLEHSRILIARAGGSNAKYNATMEKLANDHKRVFALGLMTNNKGKELLRKVYSETVILDWLTKSETGDLDGEGNPVGTEDKFGYVRGIELPSGDIGPVTKENVLATLTNLEDLFLTIKDTAETMTYYRKALVDDIVGN